MRLVEAQVDAIGPPGDARLRVVGGQKVYRVESDPSMYINMFSVEFCVCADHGCGMNVAEM